MADKIVTTEDFENVVNEYGLVPMKFTKATITENVGDVRGANPETALRWYQHGIAEPHGGFKGKTGRSVPEDGSLLEEQKRVRQSHTAVDIPEDVFTVNKLKRIAIAKQISGSTDRTMTTEVADEIIRDEMARRANSPGAEGTSELTTSAPGGLVQNGDIATHLITEGGAAVETRTGPVTSRDVPRG